MKKFIYVFLFISSGANSAQLVGNEIPLCNNGYSSDGSTCTTYGVGDCDSGYYDLSPNDTSFISPNGSLCAVAGYKATTLPDIYTAIYYHGSILGDEIPLCDNGYSSDGSTCTTYDIGDCPSGYYGVNGGTTSFAVKDGSCASGYQEYIAEDSCGFEPEGSTCISFCSDGLLTTGTGGCSALCGEGATVFRVSTGLRYPLWATKQVTPSLNVGFANGNRCYVNMVSGRAKTQAVYIGWEENLYHLAK